jgi:hypothetical protein
MPHQDRRPPGINFPREQEALTPSLSPMMVHMSPVPILTTIITSTSSAPVVAPLNGPTKVIPTRSWMSAGQHNQDPRCSHLLVLSISSSGTWQAKNAKRVSLEEKENRLLSLV